MPNTATLGSLVTWARTLSRIPVGGPVSSAMWNQFVNQGLSEIHYILAESYADWLEGTKTITLVANQADYQLSTGNDHSSVYKPLSADYISSSVNYNIPRFMLSERNDRQAAEGWVGGRYGFMLRIVGNVLRLMPAPDTTGTVTLTYIPAFRALEVDNSPVHQAIPQGWEEMAAVSAAMRARQVEEADVSDLRELRNELGSRIAAYATDRHAGEPPRVSDRRPRHGRRLVYGY